MYNVSREFCSLETGCTIEQYNRGTQGFEMTLDHNRIPTGVTGWPCYAACNLASGFRGGLGDSYSASLYTIPEYEGTRQHYRQTVAEQTRCESLVSGM